MSRVKFLQLSVLSVAAISLLIGILFGDFRHGIFIKAIAICLECIGIG